MIETSPLSQMFTQLENADQIEQNSIPKIQRVEHHLRDRENFVKHYLPRFMSIGPIHHGAKNLQKGEKYKLMWAAMYLKRTKQDKQILYQKIASKIKHLKKLFDEDVIRDFLDDDEKLSRMLFVDGCCLLQIVDKGDLAHPEEMNVKVDQLVLVRQDVLLLENQLPYEVLQLLSEHQNDTELLKSVDKFLDCHHLSADQPGHSREKQDKGKVETKNGDSKFGEGQGQHTVEIHQEEDTLRGNQRVNSPFHLLDRLRRSVLADQDQKKEQRLKDRSKKNTKKLSDMITCRNIQELRTAGIKLKTNNSRKLTDISFSYPWLCLCAELKLPMIIVDDTTAATFLNLMAYEMCPDFQNNYEICSFVAFIDSLIDNADDVKELRSAGVLYNALGSDAEVAELFNTISADSVPNSESYSLVRSKIENHHRSKCRTWLVLGYHRYCATPWAVVAVFAATLALVLAFIQAWLAIKHAC